MANYTKRPKKNDDNKTTDKLVLVIAVIQLINALIELIKEIID